jgi:integrase
MEEIAVFEAAWPLGRKKRCAFALLLYTGQRSSDMARMDRADLAEGGIWVVQQKTKAKLLVPLHPNLQLALSGLDGVEGTLGWGAVHGEGFQQFHGRPHWRGRVARTVRDAWPAQGRGAAAGGGGLQRE